MLMSNSHWKIGFLVGVGEVGGDSSILSTKLTCWEEIGLSPWRSSLLIGICGLCNVKFSFRFMDMLIC